MSFFFKKKRTLNTKKKYSGKKKWQLPIKNIFFSKKKRKGVTKKKKKTHFGVFVFFLKKKTFLKVLKKKHSMENKGDSVVRVFYGANNVKLDITFDVLQRCCRSNTIMIPGKNSQQDALFSDPLVGVEKHISLQDNELYRAFEPSKDVHYTFQLNGELFKHAQQLRDANLRPLDFAMQLVMSMYCKEEQPVLKIGAKYGIPKLVREKCYITVVDPDFRRCFDMDYEKVTIIPCALAFAPVAVVMGSKVVSMESLIPQQQQSQPVIIHNTGDEETIPAMLQHSTTTTITTTTTTPNPLQDSAGTERVDLAGLQKTYGVIYSTLIFDSDTSLALLLKQAAPRLLRQASMIIVCCDPSRASNIAYIAQTMSTFGHKLRNQFYYRTTRIIQVWQ